MTRMLVVARMGFMPAASLALRASLRRLGMPMLYLGLLIRTRRCGMRMGVVFVHGFSSVIIHPSGRVVARGRYLDPVPCATSGKPSM
ncbi:MAG: hypothetical protein ACRDGH_10585 [Candidatus Limnocylindria bacterium]